MPFKRILALLVLALSFCFAEPQKQGVCLNMIVKNESDVIEQCLSSVKRLIDYWVIVDTGSSDGTQEKIKNFMRDIPGELYERPWVSFKHNRNEALELAKTKGSYILFIDADEILEFAKDFTLPQLDKDFYIMRVRQTNAVDFNRTALVKSSLPWKWEGVLHEVLECNEAKTCGRLTGVLNLCDAGQKSGRSKGLSDEEKYLRDARILEEALKQEPNNSRYVFYLAQSYFAAQKLDLAKQYYQKRAAMESVDVQETFFAHYNIGLIEEKLNQWEAAIESFFKAYNYRPGRAEPLFRLATIYRKQGKYLLGYLVSQFALSLPYPEADACVEYNTYNYALLIEHANCALLLGRWEEGQRACTKLLANPSLPPDVREKVIANSTLAASHLKK